MGGGSWTVQILKGSLPPGDGCTMSCAGNVMEFCGGSSRLFVVPEGIGAWTPFSYVQSDSGKIYQEFNHCQKELQ